VEDSHVFERFAIRDFRAIPTTGDKNSRFWAGGAFGIGNGTVAIYADDCRGLDFGVNALTAILTATYPCSSLGIANTSAVKTGFFVFKM